MIFDKRKIVYSEGRIQRLNYLKERTLGLYQVIILWSSTPHKHANLCHRDKLIILIILIL